MDFYEGNRDLDSQENQNKDEVVNEQSMDDFSGDWAADSVKSSEDPLYGKRAPSYTPVKPPPSKKTLTFTEEVSLNNSQEYPEYSDEENYFRGFSSSSSSPPSSPLLEASPSKLTRQSDSSAGQSVEEVNPIPPGLLETEREIKVKFLPDDDCHV